MKVYFLFVINHTKARKVQKGEDIELLLKCALMDSFMLIYKTDQFICE